MKIRINFENSQPRFEILEREADVMSSTPYTRNSLLTSVRRSINSLSSVTLLNADSSRSMMCSSCNKLAMTWESAPTVFLVSGWPKTENKNITFEYNAAVGQLISEQNLYFFLLLLPRNYFCITSLILLLLL